MLPDRSTDSAHAADRLEDQVRRKERRKLRARREGDRGVWFGLGMFGLVGWSIAVPTVIGVMAGLYIDRRWDAPYSWTLMLLFAGVIIGCLNAWYWIKRESEPPPAGGSDSNAEGPRP